MLNIGLAPVLLAQLPKYIDTWIQERTLRDALDVPAAELVYGGPLVLPAKFFPSPTSDDDLQRIPHVVGKFTPCCQNYKPPAKHYISTDLHFAMHIFLHSDTRKLPLTPHYLVIQRSPKAFLLNIRGKEDWVSIDCLKHAYILPDDPPSVRLSRSRIVVGWQETLENGSLRLNVDNIEAMVDTKDVRGRLSIFESRGTVIKHVEQFRYSESTKSQNGRCEAEVDNRIKAAWGKFKEVTGVVCNRENGIKVKV
ncbi:uncharacterized protein [Palaemon carinicauda]|uniref:uncharacterized protein n=1 Tax=Palaemon carinicauda TaxID=392227 RepID=UPI0035B62356